MSDSTGPQDPFAPGAPLHPPTSWPPPPSWAPPPPSWAPPTGADGGPGAAGAVTVDEVASGPAPRRRRVRVPTFLIGLVAVALVGGLAIRGALAGSGGASSPEAAVRELSEAISREDLVGAIATLAPDEVRDAADLATSSSDKLRRLGITPESGTLGGVDLDVRDLRLKTVELGPDVAKVLVVGGTLRTEVHPKQLGPRTRDAIADARSAFCDDCEEEDEGDALRPTSSVVDLADVAETMALVAVRRDGGWYVSPFYSLAEAIVSSTDGPKGDFGPVESGPAASSPDGAVERLLQAIDRRSVSGVIDALPAGEWAVLRTYRAAIEDAIGDQLDDVDPDSFRIDSWRLDVGERSDDQAQVRIRELAGHGTTTVVTDEEWDAWYEEQDASTDDEPSVFEDPGSFDPSTFEDAFDDTFDEAFDDGPEGTPTEFTWRYADGCLRVDLPDDPFDSCDADNLPTEVAGDVLPGLGGESDPYLVVVRDRDGWAVSPVATLSSWFRTALDRLDPEMITRITGGELDTKPTATLRDGEETKVALNGAGFAVVAYEHEGDAPFSVVADGGDVDAEYRGPDDESEWFEPSFVLGGEGRYRFVVTGKAGATVTVTADDLSDAPALAPGSDARALTGDGSAVARIPLQPGQGATVTGVDDDGSWFSLYDPEGEETYDSFVYNDSASPRDAWILVQWDGEAPTLRVRDAFASLELEAGGTSIEVEHAELDFGDPILDIPAGVGAAVTVTPEPSAVGDIDVACATPDDFLYVGLGEGGDRVASALSAAPGAPATALVAPAAEPRRCSITIDAEGLTRLTIAPA